MRPRKQKDSDLGDGAIGTHNVFAKTEKAEPKKEIGAESGTVSVVFLKKAFLHWSSCKTYEAGTEAEITKQDTEILLKTDHIKLKGK